MIGFNFQFQSSGNREYYKKNQQNILPGCTFGVTAFTLVLKQKKYTVPPGDAFEVTTFTRVLEIVRF
jgi:hypothetical protein